MQKIICWSACWSDIKLRRAGTQQRRVSLSWTSHHTSACSLYASALQDQEFYSHNIRISPSWCRKNIAMFAYAWSYTQGGCHKSKGWRITCRMHVSMRGKRLATLGYEVEWNGCAYSFYYRCLFIMARTNTNNCPFLSSCSYNGYVYQATQTRPIGGGQCCRWICNIQRHGDKLFHSVVQKKHKGYGTYTIEKYPLENCPPWPRLTYKVNTVQYLFSRFAFRKSDVIELQDFFYFLCLSGN